ncbi:hypothetical protein OZX62_08855 [Bifidobacterium sp. ESL0690]|uniref:hypothetical protein n=1 Tax=Bifidobacterium sp. ESL0690 TaxID=2983214 RepID=UPI0023F84FC2|nr:hypothetical protein [Bifidobacterium sp. ESL0690]WEV46528.1 hypothetical protein OZX62_08855 [Bifidobacterium sp. ESL0690]
MTKRDFSDATKQRLLGIVNDVAGQDNYPLGQFGDAIADKWYGLEHYLNGFDMGSTLDTEKTYYRKVIDMNNMSAQKINEIWTNVYEVNTQHTSRLAAIVTSLEDLTQQVRNLTDAINPATGEFNTSYINSTLKNGINDYTDESAMFKKLVENGLTLNDLESKKPEDIARWFSGLVEAYAKIAPSLAVGQKLLIPVGQNLNIEVGNSIEGGGKGPINFDFTSTIKGNTAELEHMASVKLEKDGWEYKEEINGTAKEYSWTKKNGDKIDKILVTKDSIQKKTNISYEAGTETDNGTVSSHVGLDLHDKTDWHPLNYHPLEPANPPVAVIRQHWKELPPWKKTAIIATASIAVVSVVLTVGLDSEVATPAEIAVVDLILAA